ncbi:ABC transporter ATP-binding protein [Oceanimonas doudoroffii]|uniref:Cobalamin/Fe(3+)-siderophore ABC transporter ATP-binding protein n=1 Tax=Oceanimonas doudoroffii TaxID=84158 RepID=A0A233RC51_9GAMM|nr:ABC transporter ATP-binding protein [Oceanimonas doudoroffii]OXY80964.1 cobalamin/Fe(3+)-siderophore ABC transporter ATP-binding protein [Oceanimonas doudoroffii]
MNAFTPSVALAAEPVLEALELSAGHDRTLVFDGLNLQLRPGRVTAIVGPNGCGKSTLLNTLGRVLRPVGGKVLLRGDDIRQKSGKQLARELALLPQHTSAPEGMTVLDLVRFGRQPHQGWLQQWSQDDQAVVAEALAAADLLELQHRELDRLSGGQRQRAWIAMAMAQSTPLLLLDEPTSALDLGHQIEVFELIRRLANRGKAVVMVVHDLINACRYADELVAMHQGRVVACGAPEQVLTPALVRQLYQVDCDIMADPATGSPMLVNVRRL